MRLGKMLSIYLAAEGIKATDVCQATGIAPSNLSRFLAGETSLSAENFLALVVWCSDLEPIAKQDALLNIQKQIDELKTRTMGVVRLGGR